MKTDLQNVSDLGLLLAMANAALSQAKGKDTVSFDVTINLRQKGTDPELLIDDISKLQSILATSSFGISANLGLIVGARQEKRPEEIHRRRRSGNLSEDRQLLMAILNYLSIGGNQLARQLGVPIAAISMVKGGYRRLSPKAMEAMLEKLELPEAIRNRLVERLV